MARPRISFTFPIRWLKDPEDRKFLYENLARQAGGYGGKASGNNKNVIGRELADAMAANGQGYVMAYRAMLKIHAIEPQTVKLTEKDLEKAFKNVIPDARCVKLWKRFVQTDDEAALPVCELEVYY